MGTLVPGHQGTAALGPGPRAFFYFYFYFFWREFILFKKKLKKKFSLFFLSFSLSFSLVHTLWVRFSLMNFTKVKCEGKHKKGVAYKL